MLRRFNDLDRQIDGSPPKETLKLPNGVLELHSLKAADRLLEAGFLNFVLRDAHGRVSGCAIADFQKSPITVKGQEGLQKPNASCIMYVWIDGGEVYAQHWDGFISRFDNQTMELLSQEFTK